MSVSRLPNDRPIRVVGTDRSRDYKPAWKLEEKFHFLTRSQLLQELSLFPRIDLDPIVGTVWSCLREGVRPPLKGPVKILHPIPVVHSRVPNAVDQLFGEHAFDDPAGDTSEFLWVFDRRFSL